MCWLQTAHWGCSNLETFTQQGVWFNDRVVVDTADDRQYYYKQAIWLMLSHQASQLKD